MSDPYTKLIGAMVKSGLPPGAILIGVGLAWVGFTQYTMAEDARAYNTTMTSTVLEIHQSLDEHVKQSTELLMSHNARLIGLETINELLGVPLYQDDTGKVYLHSKLSK